MGALSMGSVSYSYETRAL